MPRIPPMIVNFKSDAVINEKYAFQVTFKDSSKKMVYSKIFVDTARKKTYFLVVDKNVPKSDKEHREQKIYVDQTAAITRIVSSDALNPTTYITGFAGDSCWMFRAIKGPITAYSYLSEGDKFAFYPFAVVAIQLNNGPLIKLNKENLVKMVAKDIEAFRLAKYKNYLEAITKYNENAEKLRKR